MPSLCHTVLNLTQRRVGGWLWCRWITRVYAMGLCFPIPPFLVLREGQFSTFLWGLLSSFRVGFSVYLGIFTIIIEV